MRTTSFDDWVLVLALAALGVAMLGTALSRDIVAPELALSVLVFAAGTGLTVQRLVAWRREQHRKRSRGQPVDISWVYRS